MKNKMSETETGKIYDKNWTNILEDEVKNIADVSQAYSWMHFKSEKIC